MSRKQLLYAIFWLAAALSLAAAALAQPPTTSGGSGEALLNLENTVAVHGYDVVAYFTENRAVRGSKRIQEHLGGATYYFRSGENKYTFLTNAPKYQPQFGGYCATSMARGRLEDINPEIFLIYNGKLYLFSSDEAQAMFLKNPTRTISEATHQFYEIAQKKRQYY